MERLMRGATFIITHRRQMADADRPLDRTAPGHRRPANAAQMEARFGEDTSPTVCLCANALRFPRRGSSLDLNWALLQALGYEVTWLEASTS
jgi:hypothetical protein